MMSPPLLLIQLKTTWPGMIWTTFSPSWTGDDQDHPLPQQDLPHSWILQSWTPQWGVVIQTTPTWAGKYRSKLFIQFSNLKISWKMTDPHHISHWMPEPSCPQEVRRMSLSHTPVVILDERCKMSLPHTSCHSGWRWPPPYKGLASLTCGYIQRWTPRWGVVIFTIPTNFGKYRSNSFYCLYNINFMKHCWPLGLPPFSLEGMPEMSGVTTNHYWPPSTRLVNNRGSVCPGSWLGYCEPEERIYSNVDAGKDGCKPALLCLPTFLPIYLFIYLCTYLLTYLPTYLHIYDFPNYSATISLTTYTYDFPNYSSTISPTTFLSTHHPTLQSLYQPKTNRTTEHGFVVIQNDTDELCC